jgi:WD40 repeat protein
MNPFDGSSTAQKAKDSSQSSLRSRIAQAFSARNRHETPPPAASYKAFISYNHNMSAGFALRLEQALKGYAKPLLARPIRIFRDEKHFAPGVNLPKLIFEALDSSEFLILLASPESAGSPWVRDELDYWCRELKRTANLLIVLVGGEIVTNHETKTIDWTRTNALPAFMETHLDRVPLYLDLRNLAQIDNLTLSHPDFKKAVNGITARFRNKDPNEMLGEEIHQHRRNVRLRNAAVTALAALTIASAIATYLAVRQRELALHQARIAVSRQYAAEATNLIENNLDDALSRAVEAVTTEQTFEARNLLFQTLVYSPEIEAFLYRRDGDETISPVAAINPAGQQIALATGATLRLFDLIGTAALTGPDLRLPFGDLSSLVYNREGSAMALGGKDGCISLLNASQGTPISTPVRLSDRPVSRVFFSEKTDQLYGISGGKIFHLSVSGISLSVVETVPIDDSEKNSQREDISVATPDGRLLVTAYRTKVQLWELGDEIRRRYSFQAPHQYTVAIREVALSPDGKRLVVDLYGGSDGNPDSYVQLYSLDRPDPVADESERFFPMHTFITRKYLFGTRSRLAFNHAGDRLVIGDRDGTFQIVDLRVLDANHAAEIERLRAQRDKTIQPDDSPRPNQLSETKKTTVKGLSGEIHGPMFAPDDQRMVLGLGTHILLWNFHPTEKLGHTLITHKLSPSSIGFSRDGTKLFCGTREGSIYRWIMPGEKPDEHSPSPAVEGLSFLTKDGRQLAVIHQDQLSFRDTQTGRELHQLALEGWTLLAVSGDGTLAAEIRNGVLRVVAVSTSREAWRTQLYDKDQMAHLPLREPGVCFSEDGKRLFVHVYSTNKILLWNAASGRRVDVFDTGAERGWDWPPAVSPDGRWVATARDSNGLSVVDTVTRQVTKVRTTKGNVATVVFGPDSARMAVAHERDEVDSEDAPDSRHHPAEYGVSFWDLAAQRWEAQTIKVLSPPRHMAFNPAGDRLAIATSPEDDEEVQVLVWDVGPALLVKAAQKRILYLPK